MAATTPWSLTSAACELSHNGLPARRKRLPSRNDSEIMGIDIFCLAGGRGEGSTPRIPNRNRSQAAVAQFAYATLRVA
jgi:hypothetical protein